VRACKYVRVKGHQEEWIIATCDTPGIVTITPNARICRHKSMEASRGLAIVKPDEPFLVKLCNFGKDQFIFRKNSTLGFAEPYQGPMLSEVLDDESPKDGTDTSSTGTSRGPLEDLDLSKLPSNCTSRSATCSRHIRLAWKDPRASSVQHSTPL